VSVGETITSSLCNIERKLLFERKELVLLCIVHSAHQKIKNRLLLEKENFQGETQTAGKNLAGEIPQLPPANRMPC
jgi:hypothetical protein